MSNDDFFRARAQAVLTRKDRAWRELEDLHEYENAKRLAPIFSSIERRCRSSEEQAIQGFLDDRTVTKGILVAYLKTHSVEKKANSFDKAGLAAVVYPLARAAVQALDKERAIETAMAVTQEQEAWKAQQQADATEAAAFRARAIAQWERSMALSSSDEEDQQTTHNFSRTHQEVTMSVDAATPSAASVDAEYLPSVLRVRGLAPSLENMSFLIKSLSQPLFKSTLATTQDGKGIPLAPARCVALLGFERVQSRRCIYVLA